MEFSNEDPVDATSSIQFNVRRKLRVAVEDLSIRGLQKATMWAQEQLLGMNSVSSEQAEQDEGGSCENDDDYNRYDPYEGVPPALVDLFTFAKSLLVGGEYQRCAYLLQTKFSGHYASKSGTKHTRSIQISHFLRCYALYMAGEKLREQRGAEASNGGRRAADTLNPTPAGAAPGAAQNGADPAATGGFKGVSWMTGGGRGAGYSSAFQPGVAMTETERAHSACNPNLQSLHAELSQLYAAGAMKGDGGFLLYLFAVVHRDLQRQGGADLHAVMAQMHAGGDGDQVQDGDQEEGASVPLSLSARRLFLESLSENCWNW
jgi:hypothetical protein